MNEAPRVAHILEATVGGTARHLTEIGCELAGLGIPQEAILSRRAEESFAGRAERLARAGVRITWVPMTREIAPGADLRALWQLVRCLRRSRPEIVHTHSSKAGILGRAAACWQACRSHPLPRASPFRSRRARPCARSSRSNAAARKTRCLVAVSHAERGLALSIGGYPEAHRRRENGVDPEVAHRRRRAGAAQNWECAGTPVVLFVGRLVGEGTRYRCEQPLGAGRAPGGRSSSSRSRPTLRRDAAAVAYNHPGPEGQSGAHPALGHRQDVERCYAAAQLSCSLAWEGRPTPLWSVRAGLPVVASDLPPLREMVIHRQTGLLVPPDDPEALAAALSSLLSNPEWAHAQGRAGRARVCERFSLRRQVEQLALVYRTLAR